MVLDVLLTLAAGAAMLTAVAWVVYKGIFKAKVGPDEYHLGKAFRKLNVKSRVQLAGRLET